MRALDLLQTAPRDATASVGVASVGAASKGVASICLASVGVTSEGVVSVGVASEGVASLVGDLTDIIARLQVGSAKIS